MPPKDCTELDRDPFGEGIQEATFEPATGGIVEPCILAEHMDTVVPIKTPESATLNAALTEEQYEEFYRLCIKPTRDLWEQWKPLVFELWAMSVTACHYIQAHPRVAHRALHGKPRVRKKNLHRIIKEIRKD